MNRRMLLAGSAASLMAPSALAAEDRVAVASPIMIGTSYASESPLMGEVRRLCVWLPASYGKGEAKYPVLYLLDGGLDEDFHHISGLANISGSYGVTREFIVVGIESGPRRRRDMTFPSSLPDDVKAIPANGGSARLRRYLAEEVIPWAERKYRASGERVVMGESLAGLFVVETLLKQPDLFSAYIAIDPSLWWNGGSLARDRSLPGWTALTPRRRVFVAMSSQGPTAEAGLLTEGMSGVVDYTWWPMPNQTHASIYHPAATDAFRVIFAPPPAAG